MVDLEVLDQRLDSVISKVVSNLNCSMNSKEIVALLHCIIGDRCFPKQAYAW